MAQVTDAGLYTPLLQELVGLYGKFIPDEDLWDIRTMIRNYFTEKYAAKEELVFAEIGTTDLDFGEWAHDPGK